MLPEADRIRMRHMLDAANEATCFRTLQDLHNNRMLAFALVRAIEIVGEAASKVSSSTRSAITPIPWPAIIGMRN